MKAKFFVILGLTALPMVGSMAMGNSKTLPNELNSQYVDNSVVTLKVKSKLLAHPDLRSLGISVVSEKSRVKLTGFVDNEAQKQTAARLAGQVEGVTNVVNALMIKKANCRKNS